MRLNTTKKFLHTMICATDLKISLKFFCNPLGSKELRRHDSDKGRFTLIFLYAPENPESHIELTYNWDQKNYTSGSNFGYLAFEVENIYDLCIQLINEKIVINRPPTLWPCGFHPFIRWNSHRITGKRERPSFARTLVNNAKSRRLVADTS